MKLYMSSREYLEKIYSSTFPIFVQKCVIITKFHNAKQFASSRRYRQSNFRLRSRKRICDSNISIRKVFVHFFCNRESFSKVWLKSQVIFQWNCCCKTFTVFFFQFVHQECGNHENFLVPVLHVESKKNISWWNKLIF